MKLLLLLLLLLLSLLLSSLLFLENPSDLTLSLDLQASIFSFACQKSYLRVDIFHKENFMEIQSFCFYRLVSDSKIHLQSAAFIYR